MTTKNYPKVINYLEYNHKENKGEINTGDSETVPNQAFTVREVLIRFNNGTLPNIVQPVYYDDTDDFDNIDLTQNPAFDLVDAENILKEINDKKKEIDTLNKEKKDRDIDIKAKRVNDEEKESNEALKNKENLE